MLLSDLQLRAAEAASKDDARPQVNRLYFWTDDGRTVSMATDTYTLVEVTEENPIAETEFPNYNKKNSAQGGSIEAKSAKQLRKVTHKSQKVAALENAWVGKDKAVATDLQTEITAQVDLDIGRAPKYHQIFPKDKPAATVTLDARRLKQVVGVFEAALEGRVRVEVREGPVPVVLTADSPQTKVRAMIMPLREK